MALPFPDKVALKLISYVAGKVYNNLYGHKENAGPFLAKFVEISVCAPQKLIVYWCETKTRAVFVRKNHVGLVIWETFWDNQE